MRDLIKKLQQIEEGTQEDLIEQNVEESEIEFLQYPEGYEPPPLPERHKLDSLEWMMKGIPDDVIQMMKSLEHKIKVHDKWDLGVKLAGSEDKLWNAIQYEAEDIMDTYRDSGEGIGTSDMNFFVRSIFRDIGEDDVWGWDKKKGVEEEAEMKSDEEMERDAIKRYSKYNAAIRRQQGLEEDAGHSIFDILAKSDVYHLVDDLEYGRFDNNSSYADILYDYYSDEMPYGTATGDTGEPDIWIKDKLMQDYGDEIDSIAQEMAREQLAVIRKNAGLSEEIDPAWGGAVEEWMEYRREGFRDARDGVYRPEAYVGKAKEAYKLGKEDWVSQMAQESIEEEVVEVPAGLRGEEGSHLSTRDAEEFIDSLGPEDTPDTEVIDPDSGDVLDWPDRETRRDQEWEAGREERERKEREQEEEWNTPMLYSHDLKKHGFEAWDRINEFRFDKEFTDHYDVEWRNIEDLVDNPEQYYEGDYDISVDMPVKISRKDGKKFNKQDRENFKQLYKIFRIATYNISVAFAGSSDEGTVAHFYPTFF